MAEKFGAERFVEIYESDRPLRGYLSYGLYSIFGHNIIPYQILALALRWLGGLAILWGLLLIWKGKYLPIALVVVLYLLYPGFLEQPHALDYQAQQFAMTTILWSISLSIYFFKTNKKVTKSIVYL